MFFDLNVPAPSVSYSGSNASKKGKGKQPQQPTPINFTPTQLSSVEARVDLLVHFIAFNQTVLKKIDIKTHANVVESLLGKLKKRDGIVFLKRLSIVLDEESEKGFGLINANVPLFNSYDLISLIPTTQATFSLACLTHSLPSPLTAHIISLPLTLPRLPFHLKHTLIRTAIKNGAVFEICYTGALGGESEANLVDAGAAESGASAKRNWWANARELARVTKGRSIVVSGGVVSEGDLRAPRDVGNLITLLGLPQDASHNSLTKVPKSVVLRAQTRKTYRAVLSEPTIVIPDAPAPDKQSSATTQSIEADTLNDSTANRSAIAIPPKRTREEGDPAATPTLDASTASGPDGPSRKKKRKKNKQEAEF